MPAVLTILCVCCPQIGRTALSTIEEDNVRMGNVMSNLDNMQSDLQIANKVCTALWGGFSVFSEGRKPK